jgi:hypothetical protein
MSDAVRVKYDTEIKTWDTTKLYRVEPEQFYLITPIDHCPNSDRISYNLTDLYQPKPNSSYYIMNGGNKKQKSRNNRRRTLRRTRRS